jgi:phage anti-repressor protein
MTMNPEYTNHITTVRHPRFGSLRIIHVDGKPWLCVTDINRILTSTKSSWGGALLSNPQAQHASGLKFVRLSLTAACLAAPRDAFVECLLSIVLTGGRIGPTPFREHPGPHQNVVSSLAVDASWLYAFTDRSLAYQDWLKEKAGVVHFPNGRLPLVAGAKELVRAGNLEMSWVAKMVITEAMNGWHTQESLDHAMTLCAEILPDPPDRIAAPAVHAFLEIQEPFPVWFNEWVYRQELIHGKDYFTSDGSRFLSSDKGTSFEADPSFTVEIAKDLMLQTRTPRGSSTRQYFIGVAKRVEADRKIPNRNNKTLSKIFSDPE